MITRTLIATVVGLALVGGSVANASTKVAAESGTKTVAAQTIAGKSLRHVAIKHRMHVSHRATIKRMKMANFAGRKVAGGKRLVVAHNVKRITPKHV